MKKPILLAVLIALTIGYLAGHLHGHFRGYESGFISGQYNSYQSSAIREGLMLSSCLEALGEEDYSLAKSLLDSSLDSSILMLWSIEQKNPNLKIPYRLRNTLKPLKAFECGGFTVSTQSNCQAIADYRAEYPSQCEGQKIRDMISKFVSKYSQNTTSESKGTAYRRP